MISARPFVVGIGGTIRPNSSSECALKTSLRAAEYHKLSLPMYEPGAGHTVGVERIVDAFRRCDGVIVSSPAYHGSVSGLLKNALDYAEELPSDARAYFDGVAVGCISCASGRQAGGKTSAALRAIVHALRGWPTPLGVALKTSTKLFDENGNCVNSTVMSQLETVGQQVVEFAWRRLV